jgi:hypothetical protein
LAAPARVTAFRCGILSVMDPDTDGNHADAGEAGAARREASAGGDPGGTGTSAGSDTGAYAGTGAYADTGAYAGTGACAGTDPVAGLGAWGVRSYQDPDSYWRRRFFILAGGFALLCAITWGLSSLIGPARSIRAGRPGDARAAVPAGTKLPAPAHGLPSGATAPAPAPRSGQPGYVQGPGKGAGPGTSPQGGAPGSATACPPARIVLSLLTSQARYSPGQRPQFEVYAVSTAPGACDLAYGSPVVRVMVTSQGHVVWDSAACDSRGAVPALAPLRFTPGVPRVATVSWNRQPGTAGCTGSAGPEAAGTFDVVATTDGQSSPVRTFSLAR